MHTGVVRFDVLRSAQSQGLLTIGNRTMADEKRDSYQEGLRGVQSTGTTMVDALEYSRGKRAQNEGQGGGFLVATVLLSPLLCAAFPITGLSTIGTAMLVSKGGPLVGIKEAGGILILLTLVAVVAAFLGGMRLERRASPSKAYRTVRWIVRLVLVPGVAAFTLIGSREEPGIGRLVLLLVLVPVCYWFLKGLDRFIGTTGKE